MKSLILRLLVLGVAPVSAQGGGRQAGEPKFHSPAEILKILSDSKMVYEIAAVIPQESEKKERPVLPGSLFIGERQDGTRAVMAYDSVYESSPVASEHLAAAERAFQEERWAEARSEYSAALAVVTESSQLMTFIGQTYGKAGDLAEARTWYERALEKNPVEYLAWLLLADLDRMAGRHDSAIERITRAHLLNRNNPRILKMLEDIYALAGHPRDSWELTLPVELSQAESGAVRVIMGDVDASEWMAYAMCRALWRYEPGYREKMSVSSPFPARLLEEKECLLVALDAAITRRDGQPGSELSDAMKRIERAAKNGQLDSFAIYEVILVDEPVFAYTLNEGALTGVGKYVAEYR